MLSELWKQSASRPTIRASRKRSESPPRRRARACGVVSLDSACFQPNGEPLWLLKTLSAGDPSGHDVSSANDIGWKRRKRELDPRCSPTPSDIPATLGVSVRADQVLRSHKRAAFAPCVVMGQERFHVGVEDWGYVKRQELGKEQAAYDRHSQRTARRAPASSSKFAPRYTRLIPPATAAPRSSAACHQIAAASDDSPPAGASSSGHA